MYIKEMVVNNSLVLQDNLTEYMCLLDSYLLEEYTEQWKYNRNLNNEKIQSICDSIKDKIVLDTVLHFMYTKEHLICFDGNHRREALILLNKRYGISIKVCCYIYICLDDNNVDKEIVDRFKIINQMTPIPDIYNDIIDNLGNLGNNNLLIKKDIIEEVFMKYKNKYKLFYSKNSKCRRPNFNDTVFKDLCNGLSFNSIRELEDELCRLNTTKEKIKWNICVSKNIIAKCDVNNFYLFI
jgi:hypothetical protein